MNWEAISAIGEVVGALAVVVSLIYLATEIRSNARATREASLCSVSDAVTRWVQQLTGNPHLAEVYHRGVQDYESLEGADSVGFRLHIFELFRQYQEIYYLRSEGGLGPRLWREFEAGMRDVNEWPGVQAWWRSRSHWFTEEFAKHVDQLQQRGTRPSLYREPEAHQ